MKSITIQPGKNGFVVEQYETEDDRSDFEDKPHFLGFYHYPDNIQDKTAFNRLRKVMIEDKERRIAEIKQEIKELKGMNYEEVKH